MNSIRQPGLAFSLLSSPPDPSLDNWYEPSKPFDSGINQTPDLPALMDHNLLKTICQTNNAESDVRSGARCGFDREGSIPIEQLMMESLWPQHTFDISQQQKRPSLERQTALQSVLGDIHIRTGAPYDEHELSNSVSQPKVDSGLAKRRRGRPRLHPSPSPTGLYTSGGPLTTCSEKRISQLRRNRIAAEKCRRRKKEHTVGLQEDVSVLSSRNESLKREKDACREEILSLKKEILRHAGCGSAIIDGYIAKTAGGQVVAETTTRRAQERKDSGYEPGCAQSEPTSDDFVLWQGSRDFSDPKKPNGSVDRDASSLFELLGNHVDTGVR